MDSRQPAPTKETQMNPSAKQASDKAAEGRIPKARATKRRAPAPIAPNEGPHQTTGGRPVRHQNRQDSRTTAQAHWCFAARTQKGHWLAAPFGPRLPQWSGKKKMGLHIDSVSRDDGERAYRLASK